jgi:hypothetical protein
MLHFDVQSVNNSPILQGSFSDGTLWQFISDIGLSNNGWVDLKDNLFVPVLKLPSHQDVTKVKLVGNAYPVAFQCASDGIVSIDSAISTVEFSMDTGEPFVQLNITVHVSRAHLWRVAYEVTIMTAP